jgi:hypothetical protein
MKPKDIYPGWSMTVAQHGKYFRLHAAACAAQRATTSAAKEALRQAAHLAAFGKPKSAKDINTTKDFDDIKREFERLAFVIPKPSPGGEGARRADEGEPNDGVHQRTVYVAHKRLYVLDEKTSPSYVATLLKERFKIIPGQRRIEDLSQKQLIQLITTVNNRIQMLGGKNQPVEVNGNGDPF